MALRPPRVMLAVFMLVALCGAGCVSPDGPAAEQSPPTGTTGQASTTAGGSDAGPKAVLMLGRSVMWGWFKHWGWDGSIESMPVAKDGYSLTYREIATPPDIAASAAGFMDQAPEGSVVFFKFCFDDFPGAEDAVHRFEEQKDWIASIVAKAEARHQRLIIGNALPKADVSSDPTLVAEHREFNEWLKDYASNSGGTVHVYDFYGVLADSDGSLKPEYASSADDSHPNDRGYAALDPSFFALLADVAD